VVIWCALTDQATQPLVLAGFCLMRYITKNKAIRIHSFRVTNSDSFDLFILINFRSITFLLEWFYIVILSLYSKQAVQKIKQHKRSQQKISALMDFLYEYLYFTLSKNANKPVYSGNSLVQLCKSIRTIYVKQN